MPKTLQSIQCLRGIAVLLVILLHVFGFEHRAGVGGLLLPSFSVFGSSGVDLFFVISGFVMVYTTINRSTEITEVLSFLYKRLTRIYPMYWLVTAILVFGYVSFPHLVNRQGLAEISILKSIALFPQSMEPLLIVGWTLIHEVYFYLCFSLFVLAPRRFWVAGLLLWSLLLIFISVLFPFDQLGPVAQLVSHPLTLEFILGCFSAVVLHHHISSHGRTIAILGLVSVIGFWILHYTLTDGAGLVGWTRALLFGPPYAILVYGLSAAEARTKIAVAQSPQPVTTIERMSCLSSRILAQIGDASYSIYLTHFLVISCIARISSSIFSRLSVPADSALDNLAFIAASFLASVCLGLLAYHGAEKRLLSIARKWQLGRPKPLFQNQSPAY